MIMKKLRKQESLLQDWLSKLADWSLSTVVNIESGNNPNPTIETLKKIAKALEISIDDLIK